MKKMTMEKRHGPNSRVDLVNLVDPQDLAEPPYHDNMTDKGGHQGRALGKNTELRKKANNGPEEIRSKTKGRKEEPQ
jgi:hypothetical protein